MGLPVLALGPCYSLICKLGRFQFCQLREQKKLKESLWSKNRNDHGSTPIKRPGKGDFRYDRNSNVDFSCVCPVIDHEFRHNIVKVAADPTSFPGSFFSPFLRRWKKDPGCGWSRDHPEPGWQKNIFGGRGGRVFCLLLWLTNFVGFKSSSSR